MLNKIFFFFLNKFIFAFAIKRQKFIDKERDRRINVKQYGKKFSILNVAILSVRELGQQTMRFGPEKPSQAKHLASTA